MICVEGTVYVCGGYNGNREATNPDGQLRCLVSVEQYSVINNQWTKLSAMTFGICFFELTGKSSRCDIFINMWQDLLFSKEQKTMYLLCSNIPEH